MDADDVDDASQLYLRLHALGLSEDHGVFSIILCHHFTP